MTADSVAQTMIGRQFDIIILNSVVQYFPDYNYLRNVIRQCESLLSSGSPSLLFSLFLNVHLLLRLIYDTGRWNFVPWGCP